MLKKILKTIDSGGDISEFIIQHKFNELFSIEQRKRDKRIGMHASSIIALDSDFCYREQVLSFFFEKNDAYIIDNIKRVFLNGWYVHMKWQHLFKLGGILLQQEESSHSKMWDVYMTPDAVIKIAKKKYVVEIKSMNTYQFKKLTKPPISAVRQCMFYMHFLAIPNGIILIEDKNTQEFKIFIVEHNIEIITPVIQRMARIKQYIKNKKIPKKICGDYECKQAKRCGMRDACFNKRRVKIGYK